MKGWGFGGGEGKGVCSACGRPSFRAQDVSFALALRRQTSRRSISELAEGAGQAFGVADSGLAYRPCPAAAVPFRSAPTGCMPGGRFVGMTSTARPIVRRERKGSLARSSVRADMDPARLLQLSAWWCRQAKGPGSHQ